MAPDVLYTANQTFEKILIPKSIKMAWVADSQSVFVVPLVPASPDIPSTVRSSCISALAAIISPDLTSSQSDELLALLRKHETSFDVYSASLGQTFIIPYLIETIGTFMVRCRPYRVSSSEQKVTEENVADMLQ